MAKVASGKRYAQALFELAQEQDKTEQWLAELQRVQEMLSDPAIALFFGEPRVPGERKLEAIGQIAGDADKLLANFLGLVVERGATAVLPRVIEEFGELLDESLGRIQATVTSAAAMNNEQQQQLKESLGAMLGKDVVFEVNEDPDLIGGMVVRVGDQIIDGSVRTKLEALRQRLDQGSLN
ncbi:MAG: F0F1 ATP synthase subunit delta [Dehalococcoidia bacterium]